MPHHFSMTINAPELRTFTRTHVPACSSTWGWVEGKTCITLTSLRPQDLPVLVVAPKRVAEEVWEDERDLWRPDLSIVVAKGSPAQRRKALDSRVDITVISRENIADALPEASRFTTLVIDELSSFKNPSGVRSKVALKLSKAIPRVIGLTGTPTPNGLLDLWHQLKCIDLGERLGTGIGEFRHRYFTEGWRMPNGVVTSYNIRPGAAARIHALVSDICMSMSSEGRLKLPEISLNIVDVPLTAKAKGLYKEMNKEYVANMELMGGSVHTAANAAVLSAKLCQIASGFLYHDDADLMPDTPERYDVIHLERIKALREIVDGTGSPILLFFQFKAELDLIRAEFPEVATIKDDNVFKRWNAGEIPLLAVHPASVGHGLNLQKGPGHTIVWTAPTWDSEWWDQGNKRLHRQGQKNAVTIHVLVSPGTLDRTKLARLKDKRTVSAALRDYLESPI